MTKGRIDSNLPVAAAERGQVLDGYYWCQNCSRVVVAKQGAFCEACLSQLERSNQAAGTVTIEQIKALPNGALNRVIAEALGYEAGLPNYSTDLNACAVAAKSIEAMGSDEEYAIFLYDSLPEAFTTNGSMKHMFKAIEATARQRAEALAVVLTGAGGAPIESEGTK